MELPNPDNFCGAKIISHTYSPKDNVCVIEFSTDVTEIGKLAFSDCSSLAKVKVSKDTEIADDAFEGSSNVKIERY